MAEGKMLIYLTNFLGKILLLGRKAVKITIEKGVLEVRNYFRVNQNIFIANLFFKGFCYEGFAV